jgi:uncharacterized protein DUF3311
LVEAELKRPSLGALLVASIPFIGVCFSVPLWDRATPVVFGLPFNIFWLLAWVIITPILLSVAYRLENRR